MSERLLEVFKHFRNAQEKYTYFLLAAAGAAVALAIRETATLPLTWSEVPLALAVLLWGSSFYCGCRHSIHMTSCLGSNYEILLIHETPPSSKSMARAEKLGNDIEIKSKRAKFYGSMQFKLLVLGAIFYIGWHVWEMWVRTPRTLLK